MNSKIRNIAIVAIAISAAFMGGIAITRYHYFRYFERVIHSDDSVAIYNDIRSLEYLKNGEYSAVQEILERNLKVKASFLSAVQSQGKLDPSSAKALEAAMKYQK